MSINYYKNRKTENYLALREQMSMEDDVELDDVDEIISHTHQEQCSINPLFDDIDSIC